MAPRKVVRKRVAKRATPRKRTTSFLVRIGQFGSEPISVRVKAGTTVAQVLALADIILDSREKAWLNGERAARTAKVKRGDIISVVSRKEAGR